MIEMTFGLILAGVGVAGFAISSRLPTRGRDGTPWRLLGFLGSGVVSIVALFLLFLTSFTTIDSDEIGHLKRVYFGDAMPSGQVIALKGQNGPQAEILSPGFHFRPLLKVIYRVERFPVVEIPSNQYGYLVALDGQPLGEGEILAPEWPHEQFEQMLDAEYFLQHGGKKGPQLTILPPGKYRFNHYLLHHTVESATNVSAGFVGVIKSNVQARPSTECNEIFYAAEGALSVPLFPKGCIGVWTDPLQPGTFYLNVHGYEMTEVPTRAQAWEYKGGYIRHFIDLRVDQDGTIRQVERTEDVPIPIDAADPAITVRVEGWIVPLELRVIAQVAPEDAPFVVASVGDLKAVEDKILTPTIRSVVRNILGEPGRTVLDLQNKRAELESLVEAAIKPEGKKAGVTIQEVRFGEPILPPELLVAILRNQLAVQLQQTYKEEKTAQDERIRTEQARATANQQSRLVEAQISVAVATQQVQVAEQQKRAAQLRGEGRKLELTEIAIGQQAQVAVLGQDRVMQLEALQKALDAAVSNPNIVKVPAIMVEGGDESGLAGFAAILGGASNLAKGSTIFDSPEKEEKEKP